LQTLVPPAAAKAKTQLLVMTDRKVEIDISDLAYQTMQIEIHKLR
jgi:hypothetical protein